jgi:CBS-domain-containing membrane protein
MILSKRSEWLAFAVAALGGGACIYILASVQGLSSLKLVVPPFGASCVLVFLLPDSPLAQPRNVMGGHLVSALMGLIALKLFGVGALGESIGVAAAILAMAITRTVHPPAGANPLVVMAAATGWKFLFEPVLIGAVAIVAMGTVYHRVVQKKAWPVSLWR